MTEIKQIPLDLIDPSPFQMRTIMDEQLLEQLAESLKRDGQQRPVKVRPKGDRYELVFGHRTFSAASKAGLTGLQAIVEDLTDEQVMWAQYAENEFREDISDYDRAKWLKTMIDKFSYTQEQLGEKIGKDQPWISHHLKMLNLEQIMSLGIITRLTEFQARALLKASDDVILDVCSEVEERFNQDGFILTAKGIEERIEYFKAMKEYKALPDEAKLEYPPREPVLPLKEEEKLEEEEVDELELEDNELDQSIVSEETLKPPGVEEEHKPRKLFQEERPKEASAEMQEFLEDRFKRYPSLLNKNDPYLNYIFARSFDITESEADKLFNEYRDQRRKAQSSGAPKEIEEKPKVESKVSEPVKELWQDREAKMHPIISSFEQGVLLKLQKRGIYPETQKEICLKKTISDEYYERPVPVIVEFYGPVHEGREDKDEETVELLRKMGYKVLVIRYEVNSDKTQEEAVKQILEVLEGERN